MAEDVRVTGRAAGARAAGSAFQDGQEQGQGQRGGSRAGRGAAQAQVPAWPSGTPSLARRVHLATQRLRAGDARRPLLWDLLLPGVLLSFPMMDVLTGTWRRTAPDPDLPVALALFLGIGLVLPLIWRRRAPLTVMAVTGLVHLADAWAGAGMEGQAIRLVVLYGIALRLPLRAIGSAGLMEVVPVWLSGERWAENGNFNMVYVQPVFIAVLIVLIATSVRTRRDYLASLVERARQLEIERDQQSRLAAAAERTRIAREMHDIIGHNLSVITGLADGGSYAARQRPDRAEQALEAIGTTSRQAMGELRRLLGILHEDVRPTGLELDPQPALADLGQLIAGARESGLVVRYTPRGREFRSGVLSAGRQLTVYRVVQEALTNAMKHAGTETDVDVSYEEDGADRAVEVTVTNQWVGAGAMKGTGPGATGGRSDAGRGISGMRERAALYDGTLEAGPTSTDGWRVRLRLPADTNPPG